MAEPAATVTALVPFAAIAVPLGVALGLSLTIERTIELFSNIVDFFIKGNKNTRIPPAYVTDDALDKLIKKKQYDNERLADEEKLSAGITSLVAKIDTEPDPAQKQALKNELSKLEQQLEYDEKHHGPVVLIQEATDPDEGTLLKHFLTHLWGFALGIILAHFANLCLFKTMIASLGETPGIPEWLDNLFTGLLIGSGSAPLHFLIGFISERKITAPQNLDEKDQTKTPSAKQTPVVDTSIDIPAIAPAPQATQSSPIPVITGISTYAWKDIDYAGGVDTKILESIHKRPRIPDSIYYHHTTMPSNSNFDDVVRTIKNRTDKKGNHWVTGYHCVILSDGSICPFCRWDRYGNQATGYNATSLGIAFNGNYETDPKIPFSNPDGRFGSPYPTEIQLQSGARVVALWMLLYNIKFKFVKPHNAISNKSCPGSQFTYDQFEKMIHGYYTYWLSTSSIMEKINQYRLKPFIIDKNWR